MSYPGMPGYETGSLLSQQKAAALRAARMEKRQRDEDDVEVLPTHISRRLPSMRPEQDMTGQYEQVQQQRPRSSQQLPPETPQPQRRRPRVVESKPSRHDIPRSLPPAGGSSFHQPAYMDDPETDNLNDLYPETGPMRRSTGQFVRNPRLDNTHPQTENPSGTLGKPLVRRAPYMYEDDPIREEFAQQVYPPRIRRSSRLEPQDDQE
jgi:hypothetical protein